jgi:hypothetical protein
MSPLTSVLLRGLVISFGLALASCGSDSTTVVVSYCGVDPASVTRIDLELDRPAGFGEMPSSRPPGVSARLEAGKLIYEIGPASPGFPRAEFRLQGSGGLGVTGRAFSAENPVGRSARHELILGEGGPLALPIAGQGLETDCTPCTQGQCQI